MSPEIQEWSHKSRYRINNLYLLTRRIGTCRFPFPRFHTRAIRAQASRGDDQRNNRPFHVTHRVTTAAMRHRWHHIDVMLDARRASTMTSISCSNSRHIFGNDVSQSVCRMTTVWRHYDAATADVTVFNSLYLPTGGGNAKNANTEINTNRQRQ